MRETRDPQEVCAIACHPEVWPFFGGRGEVGDWEPQFGPGIVWVVGSDILWLFVKQHSDWWEIHVGALPWARHATKQQSEAAIRWFAANKGAKYLTGCVKDWNEPGLRIARAVGMNEVFRFPGHIVFGLEL